MKTNSTFKFLRGLLILLVGMLRFSLVGLATNYTVNSSNASTFNWAAVTANDNVTIDIGWDASTTLTHDLVCNSLTIGGGTGRNTLNCGSYSIETNSLTMSSEKAKINGDIIVHGNINMSTNSQQYSITGTAIVDGNVNFGPKATIGTLKFTSGNHTVNGFGGWGDGHQTITKLWYCSGSSITYTNESYIRKNDISTYSCGASVSGTPVIATSSSTYCADAKPTFSVTTNATYSGTTSGYPKYRWYNASTNAVVATTDGTSWNGMTAAGSYYMKVLVAESPDLESDASNTITISAPAGNPTITADNSVSFENTVGCTPDVESISATLGNVCTGSISHSITGTNSDKFEIVTNSNAGKVYSYSVRFKENTTPGTYTATLQLTSGGTTENITLSGNVPTPTLTTDKSATTQSLMNENGAAKKSFIVTPTLTNSCATITASSNNAEFSVEDNGNGTFTVTYENNEYDDEDDSNNSASGTITFSAGGATATVNVEGSISSCSASTVASSDFNNLTGITATGGTARIGSSKQECGNCTSLVSGYYTENCLQITDGNSSKNNAVAVTLSPLEEFSASSYYQVIFDVAYYGPTWNSKTFTVSLEGETVWTKSVNSGSSIGGTRVEKIIRGSDLADGLNIATSVSADFAATQIDNLTISKLCPPEVKINATNECEADMQFSATANAISGSSISSYQWYKNGVIIPGATGVTYNPSEVFSTGTKITVKVTDDLGLVTESKPYSYLCGPIIGNITKPAKICAGGELSVSAPSVTSESGVSAQGWEYSSSESGPYTRLTASEASTLFSSVGAGYKNYYLRYYATNAKATSTSDPVQIKMFDAPVLGSVTAPAAVCDGSALSDLSAPTITADGATINSQGWEISNGGGWASFNPSTTLTHGGYDGKTLRYFAQNQCGDRTNSSTVPLVVNYPSVELADIANRTAAVGYVTTVATPSVTTNECAGTVTYTLSVTGTDASNFIFNSSTGVVGTTTDLPIGEYTLTVTATEDGKNVSDSKSFTVTVVAESPIIMDCSGGSYDDFSQCAMIPAADYNVTSRTLTENVQLSLEGTLADYFSLSRSEIPMNTENQAVQFSQTKTLPIGTNSVKLSAKSNGSEFASCIWTFTVPSPFTGSISTPTLESTGSNPNCPYDGTGTLSASASLDVSSTCSDEYPKYGWFKDGERVGSLASSYSPLDLGTIDGADAGSYTLRVFSGENAYVESPAYTLLYPLNLSIVGGSSDFYCADEVVLEATDGFRMYSWYNGTTREHITTDNTSSIQLQCGNNGDYLKVDTRDATGCTYTASVPITVRSLTKYYYCGGTGDESNLTDVNNWCTVENGNTGSCAHPDSFTADGCEFIINKGTQGEPVELLSGQKWIIGGKGTKVTIGNNKWESLSCPDEAVNDWTKNVTVNYNENANGKGYQIAISNGNYRAATTIEKLGNAANADLRDCAQKVKISGILTMGNGNSIDVTSGSNLEIATNSGNPKLGICATDEVVAADNSNMWYKPGSMVTYSGDGALNILSGDYSHLYINNDTIHFSDSANITISEILKSETSVALNKINPNGSTVNYVGSANQNIEALRYYNLQTEAASTKTLAGDIEVTNTMTIGAGSTLAASSHDITISGSGEDVVELIGKFDCGTSTVTYTSSEPTTVEAMNYYNLNIGEGDRTLSNENIIGIAKNFIVPDDINSYTYTIDGSTVEFNGSTSQSIPGFKFYNLTLNNTAMRANTSNSFAESYFLTQTGNIEVTNTLFLTEGILNNEKDDEDKEDEDDLYWTLLVSNPAVSAVGQGYHDTSVGAKMASYINGELIRSLPQGLNETTSMYFFPVGDADGYKPLFMSKISTENVESKVGVSIAYDGMIGVLEGGSEVNTGYAWHVDGKGSGYKSASIGVSTSTFDNITTANTPNAIAYGTSYESDASSTFEDIYGSDGEDGTFLYSLIRPEGYYALLYRTITNKTYYYDCSGDILDAHSSWFTEPNGGGSPASAFTETDARWIISCEDDVDIDGDLTINGANSIVEIAMASGATLNINANVDFITSVIKKGTVQVGSEGEWTIDYGFKMEDVISTGSSGEYANRSSLINNGRVNLYMSDVVLTNSYIENNGFLYSENVNWDLSSPGLSQSASDLASVLADNVRVYHHTRFINNSKIQMMNANMYVTDAGGGLGMVHVRNANGAVWLIDNTNKQGNSFVKFESVEFAHENTGYNNAYIDFICGSSFVVKHSDVKMEYKGNLADKAYIAGDVIVEDGNMSWGRTVGNNGGSFTLEQNCGNIYLVDTDNSGDGILECLGKEGYQINIEGTLYAMGIVINDVTNPGNNGGGREFHVKDGGAVHIGNIGASVAEFTWLFQFIIENGGKMYYCGNRTAGPDGLGENHGILYYAGNYYVTDPITEQDFIDGHGSAQPIYANESQCMEAYMEGIPITDNETILMPVEMTVLYGICLDDNKVELRWQTASETNNSYFAILRSFDGVHFVEIDYITGAGTTTEMNNYVYYDVDDNDGIVYYKLRQVDYDGTYTDSKVIAVQTCGKNARFSITEEEIEVFFRNPQANYVVITSVTGQIFYSKKFTNVEEARIAVPQRKGIYIISVIDNKQITSEKFIR